MTAPLLVGVDVGTSAVDACAFTPAGDLIASATSPLAVYYPRPGWAEQDALAWTGAAAASLRQLAAHLQARMSDVAAIGLAGQCPSFALLDPSGRPLTAGIIYQDNRATAEAEQIARTLGPARVRTRTGMALSQFHLAPKLLWLGRHHPDLRAARPRLAQPRDLVGYHLTSVLATDPTHAGCSGLFDLGTGAWADEWIDALDLAWLRLPPILPPATMLGQLTREAAAMTGFPAGLPVVIGAADNFCADLGMGAITPGILGDTTGTSTCLDLTIAHRVDDPSLALYAHLTPGLFFANAGLNATGAVIGWAAAALADGDVACLEALAATAPITDDAPLLLPYLGAGERTDAAASGTWHGLTLAHGPARLARSVYEGLTFALRELVDGFRAVGLPITEARLGGGGSRSQLWAALKADAWHIPTRVAATPDVTALGAALLAGQGIGLYRDPAEACQRAVRLGPIYRPDLARAALYDQLYRHWQTRKSLPG